MKTLCLDIALRTGYAYNDGDTVRFGTFDISKESKDNAVRGRLFNNWLSSFLNEIQPNEIVFEQGFYRNGLPTTALLWGLIWEANRVAELYNIPRHAVAPMTIKKFITGNGKADKKQVMQRIEELGYKITDDHQGDSISLLLYWQSKNNI